MTGKAVFVGLSEGLLAERKDSFYTVYSQANGVFISGVEIAATAMADTVEGKPVPAHQHMGLCSRLFFCGEPGWGLSAACIR